MLLNNITANVSRLHEVMKNEDQAFTNILKHLIKNLFNIK
jgi:hypothetical protein